MLNFTHIPIKVILLLIIPLSGCQPLPDPPPADSDELYELRDSIRDAIYLRISQAKQEINRQAEMMRRRAYSEDRKKAVQLRNKAERMENAFVELNSWMDTLRNDTVMGEWYFHQQEIDILIDQIGKELKTIL